ncbi:MULTISPECIES: hypothetical protein [Clostridium]|uniref:hypothetical protein n=1 Tax=Clostridium TaxID=1485 RepID=UPI00069E5779|nr:MULTISPECIES: hypothetical protein [Clostridium]MCD2348595.1 hypothetical protein [Clostridium guangxiense]
MVNNNGKNLLYALVSKNLNSIQLDEEDIINYRNELILNEVDTYINNIKKLPNDKNNKNAYLLANKYLISRICDHLRVCEHLRICNNEDIEELEFMAELKRIKLSGQI